MQETIVPRSAGCFVVVANNNHAFLLTNRAPPSTSRKCFGYFQDGSREPWLYLAPNPVSKDPDTELTM